MNNFIKNSNKLPTAPKKGVVRATFSLPESTIDEIEELRKKLAKYDLILNKSEVVRAGLAVLDKSSEKNLRAAIGNIERLKAGRPNSTG